MTLEEKGILFDCNFHYPPSETVNAFDVSIILNNALSNAIEAVERERDSDAVDIIDNDMCVIKMNENIREHGYMGSMPHISLSSHLMKNMYMIEVTNSYRGELAIDVSTNLPRTSKSGDGHGFGLANIRHAARRYYGDIEIGKETYEGEKRCVLRVMIQLTHNG